MPNRRLLLAAVLICTAMGAWAQQDGAAPLSVIDWLDTQAATPVAQPPLNEPGVTDTALVPEVTVAPLGQTAAKRVGLAPTSVTGLPDTLWSGSSGRDLAAQLGTLPDLTLPALQSLALTLLLAEADPPARGADAFDLARLDALVAVGALDPALALLEQIGVDKSPSHFARYIDLSLIAGSEATACAILRDRPTLSPGVAHDVFCAARAGAWEDAVLVLGTSRALGLMDEPMVLALERFLDPDLFEDEPPLPVPSTPEPLSFRLFQAIGTPIPTRIWPVVYANADLDTTAGWKAQLEAAERLAQRGALADNRLLGLYTQRQPAASGGIWDRVAAVQRFETALRTESPAAVAKTLPGAWRAMQSVRLTPVFANLFAEDLTKLALSGATADRAFELVLLSPQYETAETVLPARALRQPVLAAVARGEVPPGLQADGLAGAILAAFTDAPADAASIQMAQDGALGAALLRLIGMAHAGAQGDVAQLTTALASLRALGLEDVARRTALQVLLTGAPT